MDSILITGGAGFVGSQLAVKLAQAGQRVVVVDNFDPYYDPAVKRANVLPLVYSPTASVIEADVRDGAEIERIVREYSVKRIVHLAAMSGVRYSIERAPLYVEVNIGGTVNVLEAARKHGVELVLAASTSTVYGNETPVPFQEDAPADRPLAAYAATKRAAELMAHTYTNLFGLDVSMLRFYNVYGPNGRPDMMPMRTLDALVNGQEITLYAGGDLQRDWTYIDDIVTGIEQALATPLGFEIFNLGCGRAAHHDRVRADHGGADGAQGAGQERPGPGQRSGRDLRRQPQSARAAGLRSPGRPAGRVSAHLDLVSQNTPPLASAQF